MSALAERFAQAACGLVGVPFKLRGTNKTTGLDCVGLISESLRIAGQKVPPLPEYGLRNSNYRFVPEFARLAGFSPASGAVITGDLVIVKPGPAQRHLLVAADANQFIHAHAGLRRIVAMPGPLPWPVWATLRLIEED